MAREWALILRFTNKTMSDSRKHALHCGNVGKCHYVEALICWGLGQQQNCNVQVHNSKHCHPLAEGTNDVIFHQPTPNNNFQYISFMFYYSMRVLTLLYAADVILTLLQVKVCLVREEGCVQIKLFSSMHNSTPTANSALRP
jgi:hypothetical protein